jgi:hypothetical protein
LAISPHKIYLIEIEQNFGNAMMEKIFKIAIAEFFEAIIFMVLLIVFEELPTPFVDIRRAVYVIWAILGISTAFTIWFEFEEK